MSTSRRTGRVRLALAALAAPLGLTLGTGLVLGTVLGSAAPASALSCVDPLHVAEASEQLFTAHVLSVEEGTYLFAPVEQRAGDDVPPRVEVEVGLTGWEAWGRIQNTDAWLDSEYRDTLFLVALDEGGTANVCSVWPLQPDVNGWSEWLEGAAALVTEPVAAPGPEDAPLPDRLPPAPHSTIELATAGASGVALGAATLGVVWVRRRRARRQGA